MHCGMVVVNLGGMKHWAAVGADRDVFYIYVDC